VILTVVVVQRAIVARKSQRTLAGVVRGVIHALGPVVTRTEVFGTELDLRLTVIACEKPAALLAIIVILRVRLCIASRTRTNGTEHFFNIFVIFISDVFIDVYL